MRQVNHESVVVHLLYNLTSELADAAMSVASLSRIAHVIVTVMAERDVNHTPLCKVAHILKVMTQSQSVLNAEHYRLATFALIFVEVARRACDA